MDVSSEYKGKNTVTIQVCLFTPLDKPAMNNYSIIFITNIKKIVLFKRLDICTLSIKNLTES